MPKKLYVGNLSWGIGSDQLRQAFEAHGQVDDAIVITDRDTGRSRGFGFVEMATDDQAEVAMAAMDGTELDGRPIRVNVAQERSDRGGRGGGFRR